MAPDVLARKLAYLRQLLRDLEPYAGASDALYHLLAERGIQPESYAEAFRIAGREGLLPEDLASRLEDAAKMRNVLVHLYDTIDYEILRDSIEPALEHFGRFVAVLEEGLAEGAEP